MEDQQHQRQTRFAAKGVSDINDNKKKILTIRYGRNQMALIRKRLRVESWLYESLETLYSYDTDNLSKVDPTVNIDVDIDIDTMLDMEDDGERRRFLSEKLLQCRASREQIQTFINELLERLKTL